jgi:hypothetical protein
MAVVRVTDVIVPAVFTGYAQQLTMEKSAIVQSGAMAHDEVLSANLAGAGLTFSEPSFKDLTNSAENISTDDPTVKSTPANISSALEVQVRLSRNMSWSSMDLTADLIARDPMEAIAQRVSTYWALRLQAAFVATVNGVLADNANAPTGADTHTINDLTSDISGASYVNGTTNFSAEAFIDACTTMGDAMGNLTLVCVHSIVYARMLKNNLIDFMPDSNNVSAFPDPRGVPTFLGRRVIIDDGMPNTAGVFETWLFGSGAFRFGQAGAKNPTEVQRQPDAGNGSGQDVLWNRVCWAMHPVGHAFVATPPNGGPSNAATTGNLAHLDSWRRVWTQRKQIRIARLKTREF